MKQTHVVAMIAEITSRPVGTIGEYTRQLIALGHIKPGPQGRYGGRDLSIREVATLLYVSACSTGTVAEKYQKGKNYGEIRMIERRILSRSLIEFDTHLSPTMEVRVTIGDKVVPKLWALSEG